MSWIVPIISIEKLLMVALIALGLSLIALIITIGTVMELEANMIIANENFKIIEDALNELYAKHPDLELENADYRG
ncbi:MAG: hypothetical protein V3V41_00900 [Candidatus Heimdallarchaeota archaeon]